MRVVELDSVGGAEWDEVVAGEAQPFGGVAEGLTWRAKQRHVGVRDQQGRLLALAGTALCEVRAGSRRLPVVGLGGVIVTRTQRGRGLARMAIEGALELARETPAAHAMLFCLRENMGLYAKFGFQPIAGAVRARQASGIVEVPLPGMWAPLRAGAAWPPGEVEVLGEPF